MSNIEKLDLLRAERTDVAAQIKSWKDGRMTSGESVALESGPDDWRDTTAEDISILEAKLERLDQQIAAWSAGGSNA